MGTESPFELPKTSIMTVSELTALIEETLETSFGDVSVVGEISQLKRAASGHIYLTLKDEHAVLKAVIWRGVAAGVRFELEDGLEVFVRGNVDVYPPRGTYQLIIRQIEPRGLGALQLAFRQLMEKLRKEGLFRAEIKKPLPPFPARIGIVTSASGAAIKDMTNVIFRRFPLVELYLLPTRVQGEGAAEEIARAIRILNQKLPHLDLMIVGRGGGSLEDLWAFNEEVVARAIYDSRIPVVSAVGHEVDFSISDFVADVRAATPTEAGEIAVPDRQELLKGLRDTARRLALALEGMLERASQRLRGIASSYGFRRPEALLAEKIQRVDELLEQLKTTLSHRVELLKQTSGSMGSRLEALSPLNVLERGYSITFCEDGAVLREVEGLKEGDGISTRLFRGWISSQVRETKPIRDAAEGKSDDQD